MNSLNLSITHLKSRGSPQNWLRRVPIFRDCNERKYDMRRKKKPKTRFRFRHSTRRTPGMLLLCVTTTERGKSLGLDAIKK